PWPTLHVSYHDPSFEAVENYAAERLESEVESLETAVQSPKSKVQSLEKTVVQSPESNVQRLGDQQLGPWARVRQQWSDFGLWTLDLGLFSRPATVTVLFAAVLIAAIIFLNRRVPPTPVSAADLLQRATVSEEGIAAKRDQVLHRTLQLEEKSATGQLLARRRIEIWHSAEKGITARRLYEENGALVAGDWRRANGVQTIYHHGARPQLQLAPDQRANAPISFDSVWQLAPGAKEFTSLIRDAQSAQVQETANAYVISYERAGPGSGGPGSGLLKATLSLNKADLHSIELTLVVLPRSGSDPTPDTGQPTPVEYRFIEASFERRSPSSVAPAVFEPDAVLLTSVEPETRNPKLETIAPSPYLPVSPSPVAATPGLELEVLKQLNQADALFGEQIGLTRTPEGRLHILGIVETEKRKTEILQALASLKRNPAIEIQVETVTEAAERRERPRAASDGPVEVSNIEVETKSAIPAEPELRVYLSRQRNLSGEALEQEIRRYADRVMAHTRQARRHALALKLIAERFSSDDLRTLDEGARNQWRAMIGRHAKAVHRELEELRHELQPMFPSLSSAAGDADVPIGRDADLAGAAKRLFELASSVDEGVGRSFSIYATGSGSAPVKTIEFSRSLRGATSLAQKISSE
ncbi:MAG: hypothetical protein ACREBC_08235, partial [Pyrinomonadaceae bacterium]